MDINNRAHVHWACRRGMCEPNISIIPFFEHEYDGLSDEEKRILICLLEYDDPDLFNWLINHGKPADEQLKQMVQLIQIRNWERGPVAIRLTRIMARVVTFTTNSWTGRGVYFTDALAVELHPIMAGFVLSGGVRQRSQSTSDQRLSG